MPTAGFSDREDRFSLSNELHARPFPSLAGKGHAICFALTSPDASDATRKAEYQHLLDVLNRFGAPHPPKDANHYWGKIGRYNLKWERHNEFLTYTIFSDVPTEQPFAMLSDALPEDWQASAPGEIVTAVFVHIESRDDITANPEASIEIFDQLFEKESLAVACVLDDNALVASDFRIDPNGFVRFAVISDPQTGDRRLGRIVQRLIEIETYKSMSLLSLPAARDVSADLSKLGPQLAGIVSNFASDKEDHNKALHELLDVSAHLENLSAANTSRFTAAEAYSTIVEQRIVVLREKRVLGRQTFSEFMLRRYQPAIRTCASTHARLTGMTEQAARAGDMLRTRTDVERADQNQEILSRMDERAAQQLNLQKTVEGLSVVAVSYYAVGLASNLLYPLASSAGLSKAMLTAIITLPIILGVWLMIRRIRNHF